jgi:transcriptional regulator with XRE-family HTH domain
MTTAFGEELRRLCAERGLSLGHLARRVNYSKPYLSKMANGHKPVSPEVARRLDDALDAGGRLAATVPVIVAGVTIPPAVLDPDELDRIARAIGEQRADAPAVALFARLLDAHRGAGPGGPLPAALLRTVPGEVRALLELRRDAPPEVRRQLLAVASQYGQFVSRQAFDAGRDDDAERWAARALEWALAAGDQQHAAYVLMRSSSYAAAAGDPDRVVDLARAAREGFPVTPGLD